MFEDLKMLTISKRKYLILTDFEVEEEEGIIQKLKELGYFCMIRKTSLGREIVVQEK